MTQQPSLTLEMMRFVKKQTPVYEWDSKALTREVVKKMAALDVNASKFARRHLEISPQLLGDLTAGRRNWSFELVHRLVNVKEPK